MSIGAVLNEIRQQVALEHLSDLKLIWFPVPCKVKISQVKRFFLS